MEIRYRYDHQREVLVVRLFGEVDWMEAPILSAALRERMEYGSLRMILDMREVCSMDQAGLSAILRLKRRMHRAGGELRLAGLRLPERRRLRESGIPSDRSTQFSLSAFQTAVERTPA